MKLGKDYYKREDKHSVLMDCPNCHESDICSHEEGRSIVAAIEAIYQCHFCKCQWKIRFHVNSPDKFLYIDKQTPTKRNRKASRKQPDFLPGIERLDADGSSL